MMARCAAVRCSVCEVRRRACARGMKMPWKGSKHQTWDAPSEEAAATAGSALEAAMAEVCGPAFRYWTQTDDSPHKKGIMLGRSQEHQVTSKSEAPYPQYEKKPPGDVPRGPRYRAHRASPCAQKGSTASLGPSWPWPPATRRRWAWDRGLRKALKHGKVK